MLIVGRRKGESVTLRHLDGTEITVFVGSVKGAYVKLAVEAPPAVRVFRTETMKGQFEEDRAGRVVSPTAGR